MKWINRFYDLARLVSTWSKDPSTKVGTVIVNERKLVVSLGYNGFPRGVDDAAERYEDRELKYAMIVHAEANAILNAVADVQGCTMITTRFPCSECTKLIVQAGVAKICCPELPGPRWEGDPWTEDVVHSELMLHEAEIQVVII